MTDPLPAEARAERLTDALRRSGTLGDARVRDVTVESARDTILSRIIRLRLAYDAPAADAPRSVILKTGHPDRAGHGWHAGRHEVAFYSQVAAAMPVRVAPRCFEAHWDAESNGWRLVLEDLTESHAAPTKWPLPPTAEQCTRIVRALARFHAAWWDDPRLGKSVGTRLDAAAADAQMQRIAGDFARFVDHAGDLLPPERRALYERLLDAAPRLLARAHAHRNMTIAHADAHVWNTFLPRDGGSDDVRLFDWDSWRLDVATRDLAYMMALHWYPDRRRRLERALLDQYHDMLVAQGVRGYDRRALDDDYRWSTLWHIATPMWQAVNNIPPWIWWNHLERIMLAVDDLDCRALLG